MAGDRPVSALRDKTELTDDEARELAREDQGEIVVLVRVFWKDKEYALGTHFHDQEKANHLARALFNSAQHTIDQLLEGHEPRSR